MDEIAATGNEDILKMLEGVLLDVRNKFPDDFVPASLLINIYMGARRGFTKLIIANLNSVENPRLRKYLLNMVRICIKFI